VKISVICFTKSGYELMGKLKDNDELKFSYFCKCQSLRAEFNQDENSELQRQLSVKYVDEKIADWAAKEFESHHGILFIGAVGIAVRAIAGCVNDKLTDSPVIVMDDLGRFVIPLLSGHFGGANKIAKVLSDLTGATPVVTTATDIHDTFAVDVFAKNNNMTVENREGIAKISSGMLEGKKLSVYISNDEMIDQKTVENIKPDLILKCKKYALGIGCKRGKSAKDIEEFIMRKLAEIRVSINDVAYISSIDVKADEEGIINFAEKKGIKFVTFSKEVLNGIEGEFNESEFVNSQVGVGNVCERAALAVWENGAELVLKKQAENGMTLAVSTGWKKISF